VEQETTDQNESTAEYLRKTHRIEESPDLVTLTYNAIYGSILSGHIKSNQHLNQAEIADALNVSARTVREALAQLVSDGLAIREPYKGVRVVSLPAEEIEEVYELRAMLEGRVFEVAATRLTEDELKHLEELLPASATTKDPKSVPIARDANYEFHWTVIRAAKKRHYLRVLEQIWGLTLTHLHAALNEDYRVSEGRIDLEEHKKILDALRRRDGEEARRLVVAHVSRTPDIFPMTIVDPTYADRAAT